MMTYPQLSKADIERWVGRATFEEGVAYQAQRTMANISYNGMRLQAECLGPSPHIYEMEVLLDTEGIFESRCDCPAGAACQHVTALLLTWLDDRDHCDDRNRFEESSQPTTHLTQRSKEELIALIDQMVNHTPELASLFYLPPKREGLTKLREEYTPPTEPEMIRKQVTLIMSNYDYTDTKSYESAGQDLQPLVNVAHEYVKAGDWLNAATIYEMITRAVLDEKPNFMYDESDLAAAMTHCIIGLAKCLKTTPDITQQEKIERALFDIYHWDVTNDGIEVRTVRPDPRVLLLTHCQTCQTSPSAKERLATWTRAAIEHSQGWPRHHFGGFLLELKLSEPLSDDAYLRICRQTGRGYDLVNRLLDLGRVAEAEAEAGAVKDYHFIDTVDLFVSYHHPTIAERLVRKRIAQNRQEARPHTSSYYRSENLYKWLKKHATERGELSKLLEVTQHMFFMLPSWSHYQELKKVAKHFGRWESLRPKMIAHLNEKKRFNLLTEIHLSEDEVDQALATVVKDDGLPFGNENLTRQVAQSAELNHPSQAIELYMDEIHDLIKRDRQRWLTNWDAPRGWDWELKREEYAQAVSYLMRVRSLYLRLGDQAQWQTLIEQLRAENRNRTQLMEQLDKAGL